jgi:transposase
MRPQGSAEELERRRRRALELIDQGEDKDDVAYFLDVTRRSIDRWIRARRLRGDQALCAKPHPGAPSRLTPGQQRQVIGWISRSPTEFGYATELWTAARVAALIEKRLHVHYHPCYVSRWLLAHDITPQKPRRVPLERDEEAIDWWLGHIWPAIKKGPGASVHGS